jgi:hypothetical protein
METLGGKMKFFVFFATILVASSAIAGTTCSDSAGVLKFTAWQKEGGAFPGPGTPDGGSQWTYQGKVIGESEEFVQAAGKELPLVVTFDPSGKVQLENQSSEEGSLDVYTQKVTVSRKDGGSLLQGVELKSVTAYQICTVTHDFMVP